jgi:transcriptional regulator with XRE-family HTH domain
MGERRHSQGYCIYIDGNIIVIVPVQIRLARAALNLSVRELAEQAGVGQATIERFESGRGDMRSATLAKIEAVFTSAGVQFIAEDQSGGPGLRLPRHQVSKSEALDSQADDGGKLRLASLQELRSSRGWVHGRGAAIIRLDRLSVALETRD